MSNKSKELEAGIFPCIVNSAGYGENDRGELVVRIGVTFSEGPNKGRVGTYEEALSNKSGPYVARSLKAIGWSGQKDDKGNYLGRVTGDFETWQAKTGGKSTAEVQHVEIKRGKRYDEWIAAGAPDYDKPYWGKVRSIGAGPKALVAPKATTLADANDALAAALALDGDAPSNAVDEDSIPF